MFDSGASITHSVQVLMLSIPMTLVETRHKSKVSVSNKGELLELAVDDKYGV